MAHTKEDPFKEIDCWFKSRQLEHKACQNPIPWWGVCTQVPILSFMSQFFASINLSILSFIQWCVIIGNSCHVMHCWMFFPHVSMHWSTTMRNEQNQIWCPSKTLCWLPWWLDFCQFWDCKKVYRWFFLWWGWLFQVAMHMISCSYKIVHRKKKCFMEKIVWGQVLDLTNPGLVLWGPGPGLLHLQTQHGGSGPGLAKCLQPGPDWTLDYPVITSWSCVSWTSVNEVHATFDIFYWLMCIFWLSDRLREIRWSAYELLWIHTS